METIGWREHPFIVWTDHKKAKPKDSDVAQILDLEFEARQTFIGSDATKEEDRAAKIMSIHVLKILVM